MFQRLKSWWWINIVVFIGKGLQVIPFWRKFKQEPKSCPIFVCYFLGGYSNISHSRSPCHLMPSDDIYRHLFGGKGFHPYFRTGQKRETYGNRNHWSADILGNEQGLGSPCKKSAGNMRENSRSMDDWIDNQEACMLMGVSPGKLLQLRRRRAVPYSHIDRKVYYRRQDIIRFMENTIRQVIL